MKSAKPFCFGSSLLLAVAFCGALAGCGEDKGPAQITVAAAEPKPISTYFPIKLGDQTVQLQIAATTSEMQTGLMRRTDLGPDQGMVFIYARPERMRFWMQNTPLPLDIGYFTSDGVLREVYPMYPYDETAISSKNPQIQFSVEMNQGWYQKHGVAPGARLELKAIAEALKSRGFDPKAYGMTTEN